MNYQVTFLDESWGEHDVIAVVPIDPSTASLADVRALTAGAASAFALRARAEGAVKLTVTALPRTSYIDGFTVEYQLPDDDFWFSYAVVVEDVKEMAS